MEDKVNSVFGYVTFSTEIEATKIINILIERKLISCANIIPTIKSIYWWKGKIMRKNEVAAIFKSLKKNKKEIIKVITSEHSYEIPGIVFLPIEDGNPEFLEWITTIIKKKD